MTVDKKSPITLLIEKGVKIPTPASVEIGDDVNIDKISSENVVIYSGCKIFGNKTVILPNVTLGERAPVFIKNCQIGKNVALKGGSFEESTFLDGVIVGSGAEVREGCLLEEQSSCAHTVGLKQTILFPFATLGSLINFCDILLAGGTSRKNHSEVGSSYIHFNYTPNQDKATASLLGDTPSGVMLKEAPIFLGGQGGLVGPRIIRYGSTIAAGVVCRSDAREGNTLILSSTPADTTLKNYPGIYWSIRTRVLNCVEYFANVVALRQWYIHVRSKFYKKSTLENELYKGALARLDSIIKERIHRLKELAKKMEHSIELYKNIMKEKASSILITQKKEFFDSIGKIETTLKESLTFEGDTKTRDMFLGHIEKNNNNDYLLTIQNLDEETSNIGTMWLKGIVDEISTSVKAHLPSFANA